MAERDNKGIEDLTGQKPQAPNTSTPAENTTGSEGTGAGSPTKPPVGGPQTPTRPGVDIAGVPGTKSPVTSDRTPTPRGGAKDVAGRPGPSLPGRTNAAKPRGGAGQNTGAPIDDMLADLQNQPGGFDRNRVGQPLREEETPRQEDAPEESPDDDNRELEQGNEDEAEQPDGEDFSEESEAGRAAEGAEAEEAAAGAEAAEAGALAAEGAEVAEGVAAGAEAVGGGSAMVAAAPWIALGVLVLIGILIIGIVIAGIAGGGSGSGNNTAITEENTVISGDAQELAQKILKDENIAVQPNPRGSLEAAAAERCSPVPSVPGACVKLNPKMLGAVLEMASQFRITINSLTTGDHATCSDHYQGRAVDLGVNPRAGEMQSIAKKAGASQFGGAVPNPNIVDGTNHIHFGWPGPNNICEGKPVPQS